MPPDRTPRCMQCRPEGRALFLTAERRQGRRIFAWPQADHDARTDTVSRTPARRETATPVHEQLVAELCSK